MTALEKTGGYTSGSAHWNYCAFVPLPANNQYGNADTFAYVSHNVSGGSNYSASALPMSDDAVILDDTSNLGANSTSHFNGSVTYTQESDIKCPSNANRTTSFISTVICDASNTADGNAKIISVDSTSDACSLKVTVSHAAGCPVTDFSSISDFIMASKWILAVIFILSGPIIGMLGKRWFPWVVAIMSGVVITIIFLLGFTV